MKLPFKQSELSGSSFLPAEYVTARSQMRANVLILGLFGVVMFAVVAAFFVTNRQWLTVRSEQEAINVLYTKEAQKIDQLKELETQKAEMLAKAEITTALIERVPRSVLLAELVTRMPKDITLLEFELSSERIRERTDKRSMTKVKSLSGKGSSKSGKKKEDEAPKIEAPKFNTTLVLTGVARVNNDIADYLHSLQSSEILLDVDLRFIKETRLSDREFRKFRIDARINPDADARSIEPIDDARLTRTLDTESGDTFTLVEEED